MSATGQGAGGQTSDQDQADAFASFHDQTANRVLAEHGCGNDNADSQNDSARDDGGGDVAVLQNFFR
ncbi:MAG: hypothetical protein ACXWQQ_14540, partial [Pseudobdellovibrio sp.]